MSLLAYKMQTEKSQVQHKVQALDFDTSPAIPPAQTRKIPECIPKTETCKRAYNLAHDNLPPTIVNHSLRVYLHARSLAAREQSSWAAEHRLPLLFTACMLHNIGCAMEYDGPQRFEIEGGDAAAALLRGCQHTEADIHDVWQAIVFHTSPGIAERISPLARLVRVAVAVDFHRRPAVAAPGEAHHFEMQFPRLEIEKVLGDAVTDQALRQPDKAPAVSWPWFMLQSKLENPKWEGVNKAF